MERLDCAGICEVARCRVVACGDPGGGTAAWVRRYGVGRLAGGEIDCDRDDRLWCDGEVQRVGYGESAVGDRDGAVAAEAEGLQGVGVDDGRAGFVVPVACDGVGDGGFRDGQVGQTECVGDADADLLGANGHVQGLADRRVCEDKACLVLGSVRSCFGRSTVGRLTNGGGGKLLGSVNWGIDAHVSTQ